MPSILMHYYNFLYVFYSEFSSLSTVKVTKLDFNNAIWEWIEEEQIELQYISTEEQLADILTKSLP